MSSGHDTSSQITSGFLVQLSAMADFLLQIPSPHVSVNVNQKKLVWLK